MESLIVFIQENYALTGAITGVTILLGFILARAPLIPNTSNTGLPDKDSGSARFRGVRARSRRSLEIPRLAVLPTEYLDPDSGADEQSGRHIDKLKSYLEESGLFEVVCLSEGASLKELAKQDALYGLKNSVQISDDRIEISATLLDVRAQQDLWSSVYQQPTVASKPVDIDIAQMIASQIISPFIEAEISHTVARGIDKFDADSLTGLAYNSFLFRGHDERVFNETRPLIDEAVNIEPHNARALATRAVIIATSVSFGFSSNPEVDKEIAIGDADLAIELSPEDAIVLHSRAWMSSYFEGLKYGLPFLEKAVASDPDNAHIRADYGFILLQCGKVEEASHNVEEAFRLSPADPRQYIWHFFIGVILFTQKDFDKALEHLDISIASAPYPPPYVAKIFVLMSQGRGKLAEATLAELARRFYPHYGKADFLEYSAEYVKQTQLFTELQALAKTWPDDPTE